MLEGGHRGKMKSKGGVRPQKKKKKIVGVGGDTTYKVEGDMKKARRQKGEVLGGSPLSLAWSPQLRAMGGFVAEGSVP